MTDRFGSVPKAARTRASSSGGSVAIDRLTLRLPGNDRELGRRVAERASAALAGRLPNVASGHFPSLKLRVSARDLSERGLEKAVAEALLGAIERRGR